MKVTCEYCDSYVEADENMKCPLCGAGLGDAVQAEQARADQREEEKFRRESEEKAQEAKETHISEVINGVAGVATALAEGVGLAGLRASDAEDHPHAGSNRPPEPPDGHRPPFGQGGRGRSPHDRMPEDTDSSRPANRMGRPHR